MNNIKLVVYLLILFFREEVSNKRSYYGRKNEKQNDDYLNEIRKLPRAVIINATGKSIEYDDE